MSTLKITKGVRPSPVRGALYGVEGIGKSTLGSMLPNALFLDIEGGTNQLDVARIDITSGAQLASTIAQLGVDPQGYSNVVIDTADWAERLLLEDLLKRTGKKSIEDFGFGKGYVHIAEEFSRLLTLADAIINKGVNVLWLAHSKTVRTSPPDQVDGYDRYELKLSKNVAPLLKEWAELVLFAKFEIKIVEGTDGRVKAQGGKSRVLHTTHSAAWDAKNRYGLPDTIKIKDGLPMEMPAELAAVFNGKTKALPVVKQAPAPVAEPIALDEEEEHSITNEQLAKLTTYKANRIGSAIIEKALAHYGQTLDLLTEKQAEKVIERCQEEMNKASEKPSAEKPKEIKHVPGQVPWPKAIGEWLSANEAAVNAYLVRVKWIQEGQTYRDLHGDRAEKIILNPDALARAAGIQGKAAA